MSVEVTMRRGGVVIPAEELTSADQSTITGDGTVYRPLSAPGGGGLSSVTHDSTMTGDGTGGSPLAVDPAALSGNVPVAADGTTIGGDGTTGTPLGVLGAGLAGTVPVAVDGTTITGDGTTGLPLAAVPPSPMRSASYTEDFISLKAVTVTNTGGGTVTLEEDDISSFVGDAMLQSAASGDSVAVNTSDSKVFMDLGTAGAPTTFEGRLQPPFGAPTGLHDFDIVFGMVQGFASNTIGVGTFFQAGFGTLGTATWWAIDTRWGLAVDTGVNVHTGGPPQSFQIVYTPSVDEKFYINGALVASGAVGAGGLAVGLCAKWHDLSRNGDSYHVDFLSFYKGINRA